MQCPHCGGVLASRSCSECGKEISIESRYCSQCGSPVKREEEMPDSVERTVCIDGNCIGTINESGVCNVCGKPYSQSA